VSPHVADDGYRPNDFRHLRLESRPDAEIGIGGLNENQPIPLDEALQLEQSRPALMQRWRAIAVERGALARKDLTEFDRIGRRLRCRTWQRLHSGASRLRRGIGASFSGTHRCSLSVGQRGVASKSVQRGQAALRQLALALMV
jgi:hypothetical protein